MYKHRNPLNQRKILPLYNDENHLSKFWLHPTKKKSSIKANRVCRYIFFFSRKWIEAIFLEYEILNIP